MREPQQTFVRLALHNPKGHKGRKGHKGQKQKAFTATTKTFVHCAYLLAKDYKNAVEVIRKVYGDSKAENAMYVKVAEAFFTSNELLMAFEVIKKVSDQPALLDNFIIRLLTKAYLANKALILEVMRYVLVDGLVEGAAVFESYDLPSIRETPDLIALRKRSAVRKKYFLKLIQSKNS